MASGTKEELLAGDEVRVRGPGPADPPRRAGAGRRSPVRPAPDGALLVRAEAESVGRVAADVGAVLLELRPAGGERPRGAVPDPDVRA